SLKEVVRASRPSEITQQRIGEGEYLLPVGGTLAQHRAPEPSGGVAQRLLGEIIDRTGAVDAGEHAQTEVTDASPHQLREGAEMYLAPVAAPEGPRQVEVALALGVPLDGLEHQVTEEEAEVHRRVAEVRRLVIDQRELVGQTFLSALTPWQTGMSAPPDEDVL